VLTKVPLLGGRRRDVEGEWSSEVVGFSKRPVLLEAFRTLRSNLEFFSVEKRQSTWLITSSEPQEGKSTTAVNLALSMAISGKRVVVVDADLRRPVIHEYVGVAQAPGLSNLLAGASRLDEALQLVKADEFMPPGSRRRQGEARAGLMHRNIYVLASGPIPPNPAELLSSSRMGALIKDLGAMCDCVLIDAPPALAVSDAVTLSRHADGVVVVARLGSTSRDQVHKVREMFGRAKTRIVGAVAFEAKKRPIYGRKRYGYGYGYGYGHAHTAGHEPEAAAAVGLKPPSLPPAK
jgi:Mrp family chromosome partitioning ATPase